MMANSAWVWLLLVSGFLLVQSVAEDFQHHWLVPDGSKDDFSETFYNGDSLRVQWAGWDPWFLKNNLNGATEADLWVVAWNADVSSFHRYLSAANPISKNGDYLWNIDISNKTLSETNSFSLTFVPVDYQYSSTGYQIYSRAFYIRDKPSSTPTPASSTGGLSTGAKAGIGVGAGVGGLAVLAALGFLLFRLRHKPSSQAMTESLEISDARPVPELASMDRAELQGYDEIKPAPQELYTVPAELSSTPNPAELPSTPVAR